MVRREIAPTSQALQVAFSRLFREPMLSESTSFGSRWGIYEMSSNDAGEHAPANSGNLCQCALPLLGLESYNQEAPGRYGYVCLQPSLRIRLEAVNPLTAPRPSRSLLPTTYSWAKASRICFSCSSGRLVEMISKSYAFSSSTTLSTAVAPLVSANSADVTSVTFSRTCLMKSSSMPTSDIAPDIPPIAAPRKGTKKIIPIRNPQNAPQPALPPCSSRVLGFLLPWGQLTTAASSSVINSRSCMPCRATMTRSAP